MYHQARSSGPKRRAWRRQVALAVHPWSRWGRGSTRRCRTRELALNDVRAPTSMHPPVERWASGETPLPVPGPLAHHRPPLWPAGLRSLLGHTETWPTAQRCAHRRSGSTVRGAVLIGHGIIFPAMAWSRQRCVQRLRQREHARTMRAYWRSRCMAVTCCALFLVGFSCGFLAVVRRGPPYLPCPTPRHGGATPITLVTALSTPLAIAAAAGPGAAVRTQCCTCCTARVGEGEEEGGLRPDQHGGTNTPPGPLVVHPVMCHMMALAQTAVSCPVYTVVDLERASVRRAH